jgi:hypothetical protein
MRSVSTDRHDVIHVHPSRRKSVATVVTPKSFLLLPACDDRIGSRVAQSRGYLPRAPPSAPPGIVRFLFGSVFGPPFCHIPLAMRKVFGSPFCMEPRVPFLVCRTVQFCLRFQPLPVCPPVNQPSRPLVIPVLVRPAIHPGTAKACLPLRATFSGNKRVPQLASCSDFSFHFWIQLISNIGVRAWPSCQDRNGTRLAQSANALWSPGDTCKLGRPPVFRPAKS